MTLARVHAVQAFIRSASGSSMSLLRIKLTCIADLLPKSFLRPSAFYTAENVSIKKNHNQLLRFVLFKFVWNCDCDFEIFIFWCVQNSCFYHVTDFSDVCFCFSHISAFFLYLCVNIECTCFLMMNCECIQYLNERELMFSRYLPVLFCFLVVH